MAERSMWWSTNGTGHGVASGYGSDRWQALFKKLFGSDQSASAGLLNGVDNELAVSGVASPVSVATGAALDHSFFYENDTPLNLAITTPVVGTTGGHIVLRASWATQLVNALAVRNTDGVAAIPALTQVANTTWEIRLATFTITTGGVIALTDARKRTKFSNHVYANGFDVSAVDGVGIELNAGALRLKDNGVTNAKLRDSSALSVVGRATNTVGDPADIVAAVDGYVLVRNGTSLGFGQVLNAGIAAAAVDNGKIAANSIDDTKLGNNVAQFSFRQGGNASNWAVQGSTNYAPGAVKEYWGIFRLVGPLANNSTATLTPNYPAAFSANPLLVAHISSTLGYGLSCYSVSNNVNNANIFVTNLSGAPVSNIDVVWIARGPE